MVPVFKDVVKRSTAKNYRPVNLHFRSSQSTADFLTVASDRIARAFSRSGTTRAVELDISKALDRV